MGPTIYQHSANGIRTRVWALRGPRPSPLDDSAVDWEPQQARQDSNLQPPVLETGALPIELRPWAAGRECSLAFVHRRALALLFTVIAVALGAIAVYAALSGGRALIVAAAAGGLAVWMGDLARRGWG